MITNIIFFALVSRILGGAFKKHIIGGRTMVNTVIIAYVLWASDFDFLHAAMFMWLFAVVRLLPTNALLSGIHGNPPQRGDGRWQFLQGIASYTAAMFHGFTGGQKNSFLFVVIYGYLRASLAIPAMIWLGNPLGYFFMWQGLFYWLDGNLRKADNAHGAELLTGVLLGAVL